jgi:hypothetical protein
VPTRKAVNGSAPVLPRQANSPMTPVASIVEARRVAVPVCPLHFVIARCLLVTEKTLSCRIVA